MNEWRPTAKPLALSKADKKPSVFLFPLKPWGCLYGFMIASLLRSVHPPHPTPLPWLWSKSQVHILIRGRGNRPSRLAGLSANAPAGDLPAWRFKTKQGKNGLL